MKFADVFSGLQNSLNFKIMICHKLFFSKIGFKYNMGSHILLGIISLFIGCFCFFILKDIDNIKGIIDDILAYKRVQNFEKEEKKEKFITETKEINKDKNKRKDVKIFKKMLNANKNDKNNKSQNLSSDNMIKVKNNKLDKIDKNEEENKKDYREIKIKRRKENKHLDIIQSSLLTLMKPGKSTKNKKK